MRSLAVVLLLMIATQAQQAPSRLPNNTSGVHGQPKAGNAEPSEVSKLPIRTLLYPGATTRIFVRWMPWFGDEHHIDVGYRSDDASQIQRQIEDMKNRGIDGAIVDWYGQSQANKNRATERLFAAAEKQGFAVAISEDSGALKACSSGKCSPTDTLVSDLTYAVDHYTASPAYIRFSGRPLITFFGLEKYNIDWHKVRQRVPGNPLFLFRNSGGFDQPESDGAYSWIAPETASPSDPSGFRYLERFYGKAQQHSSKLTMGSAYKGFNDSLAGWGKGRVIDQRCGQTWLESFAIANSHYSRDRQLPALIIPTWNDYEEGTEIETGIDNCGSIEARIASGQLTWKVNGPRDTIDHFTVLALRKDQQAATVDLPATETSLPLDRLRLPPGSYELRVKAIGKPSILNKVSNDVVYQSNGR